MSIHKEATTIENSRVIEQIKLQIPVYHTRAMKREFCELYGRISHESKPYLLRSIYSALTGDQSASRTTAESEVDARVKEALLAEDSDIILDLREMNTNGQDKFFVFWSKCNEFLSQCTSVHERRHDNVTFMAKAISVRDLIEQVRDKCPEDTPIPSESWVRFNFCLRNPRTHAAKHYTCRLQAKHMIQK